MHKIEFGVLKNIQNKPPAPSRRPDPVLIKKEINICVWLRTHLYLFILGTSGGVTVSKLD